MKLFLLIFFIAIIGSAAGDPTKGKELYLKSCAQCHGEAGDGKGNAAERMFVKPRNFTTGAYKIRTTPNGELPTDEDLVRAVTRGLPGSTMPAWEGAYHPREIEDVVAYIKSFSDRFSSEKPSKVYSLKGATKVTPKSIESGRNIYLEMQCNSCHGMDGRADGPAAAALTDDSGNPIRPANFRKGWKFRGGHAASDISRTFMTGLNGTPMPSYVDALGDNPEGTAKAWDLANYVASLSPEAPALSEVIRSQFSQGPLPASPEDPVWENAPAAGFLLLGQIIEEPRQFNPSVDYLQVRSLYNERELAWLISWDDPSLDPHSEQTARPDALQIQMPMALHPDSQEGEKPYFLEGDASHPVGLWRWDSKTDKTSAMQGRGLAGKKEALSGASLFISSAAYADGRWRLLIKRPRALAKGEGLSLEPGVFFPIAFSVWDGGNGDEGAKRAISSWYYLLLEPQRPKTLYAYPLVAFALVGILEVLFLKYRRKRADIRRFHV